MRGLPPEFGARHGARLPRLDWNARRLLALSAPAESSSIKAARTKHIERNGPICFRDEAGAACAFVNVRIDSFQRRRRDVKIPQRADTRLHAAGFPLRPSRGPHASVRTGVGPTIL
ncbi:unnamed protein product [Pleuronectes platessa]|uniref:Uncharacterized protein n=1 Tax=Pleuronectes platessa TaxID=8262 RepID=A0A9N7YMM1_PLEPL|nr:unnamed protein product [Pleuronectes platessa]